MKKLKFIGFITVEADDKNKALNAEINLNKTIFNNSAGSS